MYEDAEDIRQISYWPSVSDLFMTLFIIALVLLGVMYYVHLPTSKEPSQDVVEAVGGIQMTKIVDPTNRMRRALGTPEIKRAQSPAIIVTALSNTADEVVGRIEILTRGGDLDTLSKLLAEANRQLREKDAEIARLKAAISSLNGKVTSLEHALNDKPPIIKIAEGQKEGEKNQFCFDSGSAVMGDPFRDGLRDGGFKVLAKEILSRNGEEMMTVDTLEIIGHTDGVSLKEGKKKKANLDQMLPFFLTGAGQDLASLIPGSNNDLGLLRALAIKGAWRDYVANHEKKDQLEKIEVRCYSAGQTIPEGIEPMDMRLRDPKLFKEDNILFRRIEIRLTKLREPGQLKKAAVIPQQ